jgi:hypothetical protein
MTFVDTYLRHLRTEMRHHLHLIRTHWIQINLNIRNQMALDESEEESSSHRAATVKTTAMTHKHWSKMATP